MPKQISSVDEFKRLTNSAELCKVVKRRDKVKLKLKTPKMLYTYITNAAEAEELLKGLKIETREF
jgi:hypothetical protein